MSVSSGSKLFERANRARSDTTVASPYDLWKLADREAAGVDGPRRELYRHAMIHAGYLVGEDDRPYVVCPVCEEALAS